VRVNARRAVLAAAALLVAGCAGNLSPTSSPSPTGGPTPSDGPMPDPSAVLLRVTQLQALPPRATFGWLPWIVITIDGRVLAPGAAPAIYPGPLVSPISDRQLTPAGWASIVAEARKAGLLTGARDFTSGDIQPGGVTARLQITADGRAYDLLGDPSRIMVCITAPCEPPPGTPEAFAGFLSRLVDLGSWLPGALGPERPYVPPALAILVGNPPEDDSGLGGETLDWPLAGGFAALGEPLADGSGDRCGIVAGADAVTLWPHLQAATQLTTWADPVDGTLRGILVRPMLPGDDDPCSGLVAV
jgi:hypothetical protein